jgi:formamidopyrimidine-DNA glycosylase
MPELPEVETVKRGLARSVLGKRIEEVNIFDPSLVKKPGNRTFVRGLLKKRIVQVGRRGKYLLIYLDSHRVWVVHLRMTGRMLFNDDGRPKADKSTRVILTLSGGKQGRSYLSFSDTRRFGEWYLVRRPEEVPLIFKMGPEPLEIGRDEFAIKVKEKNRQIKSLLLDQEFLGGIGNIYACEVLFRTGLHPKRRASRISISNIKRLRDNIQAVLKEAIRVGGSSVRNYRRSDGSEGWFALKLAVYGRAGSPCPRCGATIKRAEISGRGTFYCPGCQR